MTSRKISNDTIDKIQQKGTELDSTHTENQSKTRKLRKVSKQLIGQIVT